MLLFQLECLAQGSGFKDAFSISLDIKMPILCTYCKSLFCTNFRNKFLNIVVPSFSTQRLHQLHLQVEQLKEENYAMETCK